MSLEEDYPEDYYEECMVYDRAFCDNYEPHQAHHYVAINQNVYDCPGLTVEQLAELEAEALEPPCEHGLSARLCAGPGHYPPDC